MLNIIKGSIESSAIAPQSGLVSEAAGFSFEKPHGTSPTRHRDAELDFVKGVLVLIMVLYHWCNYFVSLDGFGYRYIRFVTPSFVFLSGFVVTNLLTTSACLRRSSLANRLFVRGVKLLALLTVLNLLVGRLEPTLPSGRLIGPYSFVDAFPASYLTGQGVTFSVLLPISYTLLLASFLLRWSDYFRTRVVVTTGVLFTAWCCLALWGIASSVFELIGAGLFGLVAGSALSQPMPWLRRQWPWLALAYVLHIGALTAWGVPYPMQLTSVCANLWLFYCLAHLRPLKAGAMGLTALLGRYTLLAYLGQIAILQLLATGLRWLSPGYSRPAVALVAASVLTSTLVAATDWSRRRMRVFDSLYRFVFA